MATGIPVPDKTFRAAQLLYAQTLAKRSPLLGLAETDPLRLKEAVAGLTRTRGLLADAQTNSTDRAYVESALYPIATLQSLAALEETRQKLLSGAASERDYELAQASFLRVYRHDLAAHERAFQKIVPLKASPYEAAGIRITRADIETAFSTLTTHIDDLEQSARIRARCLSGQVSLCKSDDLIFPTVTVPSEESLDAKSLSLAHTLAQDLRSVPVIGLSGPLVELAGDSCARSAPGGAWYVLDTNATSSRRASYVGDIRLLRVDDFVSVPFYKTLKEKGFVYAPAAFTLYYQCTDTMRDASRLSLLSRILKLTTSDPWSAHADADTKKILADAEKRLTTDVVREADALQYLALAAKAASAGHLDTRASDSVLSLTLASQAHSTDFDRFVSSISSIEDTNYTLLKAGLPVDLAAPYLWYARSPLSGLFGFGMDPLFTTHAEAGPYVYYSELTKAQQQQARTDVRYYYQIHASASTTY
jgi:hypothetical protein